MELARAKEIAAKVIEQLKPYCSRIEIAGSIRRQKRFVNDIDICLVPSDPWRLHSTIVSLGQVKMAGLKIQRVTVAEAMVDIYIGTEETWATLLLIRTGSKEHNIKLCSLAKSKGMQLKADGTGLFELSVSGCDGEWVRIAGDTEESIFEALGLKYLKPEERN
jgi:DNA polymerase (family 10)